MESANYGDVVTSNFAAAPRGDMDYGDWVLNWWWPVATDTLSENTRANYRTLLNHYVIPYFEMEPLDSITKGSVRAWITHLDDADTTTSTIDAAIRVFRTTMMAAMAKGLIGSNPLAGARAP